MEKFKVKKKHIVGELKGFPKHIVQRMVDEQVNQGNEADPSVFTNCIYADKNSGGFSWHATELGHSAWSSVIKRREFDVIPKPKGHVHAKLMKQYAKDAMTNEKPWELWEVRISAGASWLPIHNNPQWYSDCEYRRKSEAVAVPTPVTPNEIIRAMLAKGMDVWACISDISYDDARDKVGHYVYHVTGYDVGSNFPVRMREVGWKWAVPVDLNTMTEITELP